MVEARCCYFGGVLFNGQLFVQIYAQITHDGRRFDEYWTSVYRAITTLQFGEVRTGSEPDYFGTDDRPTADQEVDLN